MCILYTLGRDPFPYDYRDMQFSLSPKFSTDKFDLNVSGLSQLAKVLSC